MRYQFTRSARKHRIGRASAQAALVDAGEPVEREDGTFLWIRTDECGRELEIIGSPRWDEGLMLIIHVVPAHYRRNK